MNGRKPNWHLKNVITNEDMFGRPVPTFSLKGEDEIKTISGGILTIIMILTIIAYGSNKAVELFKKNNPVVNVVNKPNAINEAEIINIGASDFRFSFGIEIKTGKIFADDPAFIRWRVRHFGRKNGEYFQNFLPFHKCTAEDMDQFYPISDQWARSYTRRLDDQGIFQSYCID